MAFVWFCGHNILIISVLCELLLCVYFFLFQMLTKFDCFRTRLHDNFFDGDSRWLHFREKWI